MVGICFRYLSGVLGARSREGGYPKLTKRDVETIKRASREAGVHLPSDTVLETIKRVYNNFKTAGGTSGSRPKGISPFIPVRVSKVTPKGRGYSRNLTIEKVDSPDQTVLAVTLSLGDKLHKRRAVCFITSRSGEEPFTTIRSALKGDEVFLGDPSILVRREGRYFVQLSASRGVRRVGNESRVLGVDLGISGPAVVMFAVEFSGVGTSSSSQTASAPTASGGCGSGFCAGGRGRPH